VRLRNGNNSIVVYDRNEPGHFVHKHRQSTRLRFHKSKLIPFDNTSPYKSVSPIENADQVIANERTQCLDTIFKTAFRNLSVKPLDSHALPLRTDHGEREIHV